MPDPFIKSPRIYPSLLAADGTRLGDELTTVVKAGVHGVHLDIMDGHFVPNLSIGPGIVNQLRPLSDVFFDVHLMVKDPDRWIDPFVAAGADGITIHVEACIHLNRTLEQIKAAGKRVGMALNPATPLSCLDFIYPHLDLILVMTVDPGFGGQTFQTTQLEKIRQLHQRITTWKRPILIQVDGGITPETAPDVVDAGADILVAGSAIFKAPNYAHVIQSLQGTA